MRTLVGTGSCSMAFKGFFRGDFIRIPSTVRMLFRFVISVARGEADWSSATGKEKGFATETLPRKMNGQCYSSCSFLGSFFVYQAIYTQWLYRKKQSITFTSKKKSNHLKWIWIIWHSIIQFNLRQFFFCITYMQLMWEKVTQ